MTDKSLSDNITAKDTWTRILFIILFWLLQQVARIVIGVVSLVQIIWVLMTGEKNQNLLRLGSSLSQYLGQIFNFVTYNNDEKPYPFAVWPEPVVQSEPEPELKPEPEVSAANDAGQASEPEEVKSLDSDSQDSTATETSDDNPDTTNK